MRSDNDSEHNSQPQRPHSDSNQISFNYPPKISSRKKVVKSADHEPQQIDDNTDFLEPSHHQHQHEQPAIKPVIKKQDLANEYEFGKNIMKSEEFSVDAQLLQSANKEKLHRQIKQRELHFEKLPLNIIVCGGKEIGKTSFIEAFSNSKLCGIETSRIETTDITSRKSVRKVGGQIYDITMIDTPGYKEGELEQYISLIVNDLTTKLELHHEKEEQDKKDYNRNKIIYGDKRDQVDERVHCCLYFLKGPKVHEEDCLVMKTLQRYVNIIPILAKGDCYTMQQIKKFKRDLFLAKQKHGLIWMECEEILRSKHPQNIKQLLEGPFGVAPPFVIVSGVSNIITSSNRVVQGRVYNWGIIDISNPKHSDFSLLTDMILIYFSKVLVELTMFIQVEYVRELEREVEKQLKEKRANESKDRNRKKQRNKRITTMVGGAAVAMIGWVIYKVIEKKAEKG